MPEAPARPLELTDLLKERNLSVSQDSGSPVMGHENHDAILKWRRLRTISMSQNDDGTRLDLMRLLVELGEEPAFVKRSQEARQVVEQLYMKCARDRERMLEVPRIHLGELGIALRGDWSRLSSYLKSGADYQTFAGLHEEWKPEKIESGISWFRTIRGSLKAFIISLEHFNREWETYLRQIDLESVNEVLSDYNRYYPIEMSCAFDNQDVVRLAFQPLKMLTRDKLLEDFPLLLTCETA